ncbi:hypothetical protein EJ04DRAFT_601998 [Polyplosphaeria fusca]|uniref:Uncharacterized protein n=1 Tax=Polyplosphaeria fusca TaxID=682080 RepID=A0A9P4QY09_9PLEO|nr:hypothetical protein EJ04DRAFT_601998 [Polyplosphaeria fusca]
MAASEPISGPWCKDFESLKKSIVTMPEKYKDTFDYASGLSLAAVCEPSALHIYEMDSDLDSLLLLTQVVLRVRASNTYVPQVNKAGIVVPNGMIVLVEKKAGTDDFARIYQQMEYLTQEQGHLHLSDTYCSFGAIAIVKGIDNTKAPNKDGKYPAAAADEVDSAVQRLKIAITRTIEKSTAGLERIKNIIWHHGPVIHFLNHFIAHTDASIRNRFKAITIHNCLDFTKGILPSTLSNKLNKIQDFNRLESYLKRLSITATFLDSKTQGIHHDGLSIYIFYYAFYINTLLAPTLTHAHHLLVLDSLLLFSYRLHGAAHRLPPSTITSNLRSHLPTHHLTWAHRSTNPSNYTKPLCQSAGTDAQIHHATALSHAPFAPLRPTLPSTFPALSRLFIGPAAALVAAEYYLSIPLALDWRGMQIRVDSRSVWRLHVPHPAFAVASAAHPDAPNSEGNITERVRGTFGGVIEALRGQRGEPGVPGSWKGVWEDVRAACGWALEGCEGRLPKGMGEKVRFVGEGLRRGVWVAVLERAVAMGGGGGGGGG